MVAVKKKCSTCLEVKSLSDFYTNGRPYKFGAAAYTSKCKACVLEGYIYKSSTELMFRIDKKLSWSDAVICALKHANDLGIQGKKIKRIEGPFEAPFADVQAFSLLVGQRKKHTKRKAAE